MAISLLAACGPSASSTGSPATGSSPGTQATPGASSAGADSELVVAVTDLGTQQWSPWLAGGAEEIILHLVSETLVRTNVDTGQLEGGLAESWSLSEDALTWTFKLRPDIPFHDGHGTVTSEDVKFSWEQWIREDSETGSANTLTQAIDGKMDNFEIVSPLEFKVHATDPVVYLPADLADSSPGMMVQSKEYWESDPDQAALHPIGTGPFVFVSSDPGREVKLAAVEDHWRQTPAFKNVTIRIVADDAAKLAQVASGDVDLAPITPRLVPEAQAAELDVLRIPSTGSWVVAFGGQYWDQPEFDPDAPWIQADDPEKGRKIRQAISFALDRATILDKVMHGFGELTPVPLVGYPRNPKTIDPSLTLPEFNLARAKELLAEGGYPDGFEVTVPIFDRATKLGSLDMAEAFASSLEALGLQVKRLPGDYSGAIEPKLRALDTKGWMYVYPAGYDSDAVKGLRQGYRTGSSGLQRINDPKLSEFIDRLGAEPDYEARFAITQELGVYLAENLPFVPIFTADDPWVVGDKVGSWKPVPGLAELSGLEYAAP